MAHLQLETNDATPPAVSHPWPTEPTPLSAVLAMIEHVDYGLLLLSLAKREVVLANKRARRVLLPDSAGGLVLSSGRLRARSPDDELELERALCQAAKGVRSLLPFADTRDQAVGVIPAGMASTHPLAMIVFSRPSVSDSSSMALYARACSMTAAESNVLSAICAGLRPHEVARACGVQVSTVRSQLRSIRLKSRTRSIRHLVETVSLLPPVARGLT